MSGKLVIGRGLRILLAAGLGTIATSCTQVGDGWVFGSSEAAAKDQVMLVRPEPPSFGYQRLAIQARIYPDLEIFVSRHGLPSFLAETGNRERHYLILYYLEKRQAFACRTRDRSSHAVEFAGPYPITDREFKLLDNFRRNSGKAAGALPKPGD